MSTAVATLPLDADPAPTAARTALPWPALAAFAVGFAALFGPSLLRLADLWDRDPNYSHGYFVPVIAAVLAYGVARRAGAPDRGRPAVGAVSLAAGVGLHLATDIVRWPPLDFLAIVFVLRGSLVAAGGAAWASRFTFPILFLFFMFPLPITWTGYLALVLQDLVSKVAESVLGLFLVVYRQGHTLHIAGMDSALVVAAECSGLRQLVAFLAFAALYGYLAGRSVPRRALLVLAAVPVAVLANVLRVLLMNLGAYWFGTNWMSGLLHHTPVLFSLPVGLALFLLFDRVLCGSRENDGDANEKPAVDAVAPADAPPQTRPAGPGRAPFVLAGVLLAAAGADRALSRHVAAAGAASFPEMAGRFEGVPLAFPPAASGVGWEGVDFADVREKYRKELPFAVADLMYRGYRTHGSVVSVYAVHTKNGEDRKHHPEICMRDVSGAPEDLAFRRAVPLDPDGRRAVQRFRFVKSAGQSVVVYYWYYTLLPTPAGELTAVQRLHQRMGVDAPSVTVQVTTTAGTPDELAAVERSFLPALDAAFRRTVLPPSAAIGHDRLPVGLTRE